MTTSTDRSDLTKGSLWRHIGWLAIPASTGLFFNVLFNITDTFFAGMWSTDAQAGLGFSFPLFFILIALFGWPYARLYWFGCTQ